MPLSSRMTSPARTSPAAEGTKAMEPGARFLGAPGRLSRGLFSRLLGQGRKGRLFGIDHLQALHPPLAALGPHHTGQRADRSLIDIGHLKAAGVQFVARPHRADDGHPRRAGLHDQGQLAGDGVDGVHHIAVLGKIELPRRLGGVKGLIGADGDVGVDVPDAGRGGVHLVHPQGSTLYIPSVERVAMICRLRLDRQTLSSSTRSSAPTPLRARASTT